MGMPGTNFYMGEEAMKRALGYRPDARNFLHIWLTINFEVPEYNEFVDLCMIFSSLTVFSPYVLLWVTDWLLEFAYKRELTRLRLIESVLASCDRVREARDKK